MDAVEKVVTDANDSRLNVALVKEGTLVGGYMGGGKVTEVRGEEFEEKAIYCVSDRDGAEIFRVKVS